MYYVLLFLKKHSPKGVEPLVTACAQDDRSIFLEDACNVHERFPIVLNGIGRIDERVQEYERDNIMCLP